MLAADETLPGFGIYLTSGGKAVFALRYEKNEKTVTEIIGKVSKMSLKKAHKRAAKLLSDRKLAHEREPVATPAQPQPAAEPTKTRPAKSQRTHNEGADRQAATTKDKARQLQTKALEAMNSTAVSRKLITFDELKDRYGIPYGRKQIARLEAAGAFPKRVPIGEARIGWLEYEIEAYLEQRISKRAGGV